MEQKKKIVIHSAFLLLILMTLFPPFELKYANIIRDMGYGFIFSPPKLGRISATVNVGLLFLQYFIVIILAGWAWFYLNNKDIERDKERGQPNSLHTQVAGYKKALRWGAFAAMVVLILATNAVLVNILEKGFVSGSLRVGISLYVLYLTWGWARGTPHQEETTREALTDDETSKLLKKGCSLDAIDYLERPILAAEYIRKYGTSEKAVNDAISKGMLKSYMVDGYLWVQDHKL